MANIDKDTAKDDVSKLMETRIRERIKHDLSAFKYGMREFHNMEALIKGHSHYQGTLMRIEIRNGRASCANISESGPRLAARPWMQPRKRVMMDLIVRSLAYMEKTTGKKLPDMMFYLYPSDTYAFAFQKLPMFCIAKPGNRNGILIPDNTFLKHPDTDPIDWDHTKQEVVKACKTSPQEREQVMFFRGSNTSMTRGDVRGYLADLKTNPELPLHIDVPRNKKAPTLANFDPIWSFCKYKYLLNLPGGQPWSYRKKFLFLLKSMVIDVVYTQRFSKNDANTPWINFYDNIFESGKDYVELVYEWTPEEGKIINLAADEFKQLEKDLKQTFKEFQENPDKYNRMVESCSRKAHLINLQLVYRSVFSLLFHYSECVERDGGARSYAELRNDKHVKHSKN